jgi:sigma-54 dependent transcriptional regulator, acetoin dehydrogenase operon transcriptional activator AcoR
MGGVIDLHLVRRSTTRPARRTHRASELVDASVAAAMEKLRNQRVHLREVFSTRCGPDGDRGCTTPASCLGDQAIGEILDTVATAEEQLMTALERAVCDRTMMARLAAATRDVAAIEASAEIIAAFPVLALAVCPCAAGALLEVRPDGSVRVLARAGGQFEAQQRHIDEEARAAVRDAGSRTRSERACDKDAESRSQRVGHTAIIPLAHGTEALALVLERPSASPCFGQPEIEHLTVFASVAGSTLARARARDALSEAAARDAATLSAIRDGIIAVDHDGIVREVNQAAATVLGVRREDVVGRRLRDVPGLSGLAPALAGSSTEQTIAHRVVGSVARYTFDNLVGAAPAFRRVIEEAKRVAASDLPVLISGESGTGKELVAQAIHNASGRAAAPFLGINVTAIPRELLESELFGYEGGTFTGARSSGRAGKFELAGRGTLLLDEIGDMPVEMQGKLLRVVQERIVQRLGSARDIQVRARIVATTNRDLSEAVELGRFRLDLFHRLRVLELRLPPLSERSEDVPLLVAHHLRMHTQRTGRRVRIAPHVLAALQAYDWPGNVRELLNVLDGELSVLPPGANQLTRVPAALLQNRPARSTRPAAPEILPLEEMERRACEHSLAAFHGNVARAARALGVAKVTLYRRMKRYGIAVR